MLTQSLGAMADFFHDMAHAADIYTPGEREIMFADELVKSAHQDMMASASEGQAAAIEKLFSIAAYALLASAQQLHKHREAREIRISLYPQFSDTARAIAGFDAGRLQEETFPSPDNYRLPLPEIVQRRQNLIAALVTVADAYNTPRGTRQLFMREAETYTADLLIDKERATYWRQILSAKKCHFIPQRTAIIVEALLSDQAAQLGFGS